MWPKRLLSWIAAGIVWSVAAPASAGEQLALLSYNIHAAAPLVAAFSEPGTRAPLIAELLGDYDLVLLQEDFAFHDALIGRLTQTHGARL